MSRHFETLPDGRFRLVIDPEDGTQPQYTYGKDKDEILEKVTRTAEHAARWIAPQKQNSSSAPLPKASSAERVAPARKPMTADEQMRATSDLSNPAKAPQAVASLVNEATGGALDRLKQFEEKERRQQAANALAETAARWASQHPEFPRTPTNKKLLLDTAVLRVGIEAVTEDVLQSVYQELLEGDYLQDSDPAGQPDETPATRPARAREATSYRRTNLRATTPAPSTAPKYTRAEIDKLPADELLKRYNSDPEFRRAVDTYSQPRAATA
jgi:hypothetical protein